MLALSPFNWVDACCLVAAVVVVATSRRVRTAAAVAVRPSNPAARVAAGAMGPALARKAVAPLALLVRGLAGRVGARVVIATEAGAAEAEPSTSQLSRLQRNRDSETTNPAKAGFVVDAPDRKIRRAAQSNQDEAAEAAAGAFLALLECFLVLFFSALAAAGAAADAAAGAAAGAWAKAVAAKAVATTAASSFFIWNSLVRDRVW